MKKLQKGRSMIEMLGVLAIIGVLSIGGLAGYTMAMNRWRANTLLDYVTRCVVVAQTKDVSGMVKATKTCTDELKESFPGFLGDGNDLVQITKGPGDDDADSDEIEVTVKGASKAVQDVLHDKLATRVNGVKFTKDANDAGGSCTFSFLNTNVANQ